MTVGSAGSLRSLVTRSDSHPALVPESGAVLSYAGLQRALDRAAGRLAALGVREGDRVALAAANGPALIVAFLAVVASGAVAAPLNPALGEAELTAELEDLRVSRLLHDGVAAAVAAAGRSGVAASVFGYGEGLLHIDGEAGAAVDAAGSAGRAGPSAAYQRHDKQAEDRADSAAQPGRVDRRGRGHVRAVRRRRDCVRHAALPRARPGRHGACHAVYRRHGAAAAVPAVDVLGRTPPGTG